jgi:macrodomain Ter protein organizer (MatP/YcbG family)
VASVSIEQLASQAEKEGVTLAEMISKHMSAEEIDRTQAEIHAELARNYTSIEDFMQDIESSSFLNLAVLSEEELRDLQEEVVLSLSDSCGVVAEQHA